MGQNVCVFAKIFDGSIVTEESIQNDSVSILISLPHSEKLLKTFVPFIFVRKDLGYDSNGFTQKSKKIGI